MIDKLIFKSFDVNATLPCRKHEGDAGLDATCISRVFLDKYGNETDILSIPPKFINIQGKKIEVWQDRSNEAVQVKYDLGVGCKVPKGYMLMVACRSSVYKTGMDLSNSFGTVDYGYQGRIYAIFNLNEYSRPYHEGDTIVQLILVPIELPEPVWGEFTEETERGTNGHGSTGGIFGDLSKKTRKVKTKKEK